MGKGKFFLVLGILLIFLPQKVIPNAQDSLYTGYNRGLNTDSWKGGFVYQKLFSTHSRLHVYEAFSSSRLRVSPSEDKWKDQQNLLLNFSRLLTSRFSMNLFGSSLLFSDKQSGYRNDIRTHLLGIGMSYNGKNFQIPVFIGSKDDRRFGQTDQGLNYRVGMYAPHFRFGEYKNQFGAGCDGDEFRRRKNSSLSVSYLISRQFYAETSDTLMLSLNHHRRDYYVSESGIIESREEKEQRADNTLTYRIGSGFLCHLSGGISSRSLKISLMNGPEKGRKRERNDFNTLGAVRLFLRTPSFRGNMALSYTGTEQKYKLADVSSVSPYSSSSLLSTPDNRSAYTTLSIKTGWKFLATDSLSFACSLQRYWYDTPDPANFDDRDELRYWLDFREIHTFSPNLMLHLSLHLNVLHFVYIYGEKSANNNWTRILRFSSAVSWRPSPRWKISQSAEVLANYVDYDFESYFTSVRSFLYRKFRFEDSTRVDLSPKMSLRFFYRLELDENGKFIWDRWLEQKLIDRHSHTLTLSMDYRPWRTFAISPGYTFYSRRGYRYDANTLATKERELTLDFRSYGPYIQIYYHSDRLRFILTGSTISTKNINIERQVITRIEMGMNWTF